VAADVTETYAERMDNEIKRLRAKLEGANAKIEELTDELGRVESFLTWAVMLLRSSGSAKKTKS
jgi:predicted RNase H-like nuclease (RuvC/YqgF family)